MKIALISHLFPTELHPHHGKFIQDQLLLLENAPEMDVELVVPTPHSIPFTSRSKRNQAALAGNHQGKRLNYLSFPKKRFPNIIASSLSKSIEKHFKNKSFDLVHVHWLYPDALCIPKLKEMGMKCVLTIHGSDWYQTKVQPELFELLKETLIKTDLILCSGPKLKQDIDHELPELATKSAVVYNMVDTEKYKPVNGRGKNILQEKLGWQSNHTHSLTVANLRHEKGIDLLLDAVNHYQELSSIQFHIIGASRNDDYGKEMIQKIHSATFQNIQYHPPVHPDELISYYQSSDLFVLPSRREGFNVSLLEALSCGIPSVCTNVGGSKMVIGDENGLITKETKAVEIQKSISRLAAQLDTYNPEKIHHNIKEQFGKKAFLKRLTDYYNSIL